MGGGGGSDVHGARNSRSIASRGGHDGTRTAGSPAYPWATRETFPIKNTKNEDCRIAEANIIGFSEKSKLRSLGIPLPSQPMRQVLVENLL